MRMGSTRSRGDLRSEALPAIQRWTGCSLALAAGCSLAFAVALTACTQVAGTSAPSLVRVIDASYIAPPLDATAAGMTIASNIGQGTITQYGTISPSASAVIAVTAASGGSALAKTQASLVSGGQESIFVADNGAAKNEFAVTVLEDQATAAPKGESSFRFLNQAPKTGAVDVYMVPDGSTLAKSTPLVQGLAVGGTTGYVSFNSESVTMVVTAAGSTKAKYTSKPIALVGGEVRTALILDTALTSNPAVAVFVGDDVN